MSANPTSATFDWKRGDYLPIILARVERLKRIQAHPELLPPLRAFYREHPAQFITDFGWTSDPRLQPATIPLLLFPMQHEMIEFILGCWRDKSPGLIEKSRDVGASVIAMSLACTLCIFNGVTIGIGSRKEQLLDNQGDPSSLFYKAREFLKYLPPEFRPEYACAHMRIVFANGSAIIGEAGAQIGRGARTTLFIVDEAAFLESPLTAEGSLSATTDTRIDISSVNGLNNPFAQKRFSGKVPVFTAHWKMDPRKDEAWHQRKRGELLPAVWAGEYDLNYMGSVEGQVIPSEWVQAAIGAHLELGLRPSGSKYAGLDVADRGANRCALAGRHGFLLEHLKSWSGTDSTIFKSVAKAFALCEEWRYESLHYDADGMGAGARGDADEINAQREAAGRPAIRAEPYRGSGQVYDPEGEMVPKRKNKDYFANMKAMAHVALRNRFEATWKALHERGPFDPDKIISIDPNLPELLQLQMQLSQPTYSMNSVGKLIVDKQPDGMPSPDLADCVCIAFQPGTSALETWIKLGLDAMAGR